MANSKNLENLETHFEFGQNWADFAAVIDQERIDVAKESIIELCGTNDLTGKTFLDIGCGSGLFSLAASILNASHVFSVDIDPNSVATTKKVLQIYSPNKNNFVCEKISVFDLDPAIHGKFDLVYSWGVLHHTGNMYKALRKAAAMVKSNGKFAISLYRKTKLCNFWRLEKAFYSKSPSFIQGCIRFLYTTLFLFNHCLERKNPIKFIKEYKFRRGMSFMHDAHDWLGGYPYESISPEEMERFAKSIGFYIEKKKIEKGGLGLWGSGCDEYLLKRIAD